MDKAAINTLTFTWIADSIPAYACYVDSTLHYRFMNAKYREMFGINSGVDYESYTMLNVLGKEAFSKAEPSVQKALKGEFVSYEVNINELDPKILQVHYVPDYMDESNQELGVRGFFMMALDVTELRLTQLNYKKDLVAEVEEKTKYLSEAIQELHSAQTQLLEQKKMASLGLLVAGIAHELNTPIGTSFTAISRLQEKNDVLINALDENKLSGHQLRNFLQDNKQVLKLTERNIQCASKLINTFKSVNVSEPSEAVVSFQLLSVINNAIKISQGDGSKFNIEYSIDVSASIHIKSHPRLLLDVLSSLLSNSYTHGFSENLVHHIEISAECINDVLKINYTDDGKGLNDETKERIFEPFFSTKPANQSTGLGMTILYNIVHHQLHGEIRLNKNLQKGMQIELLLPYQK